MFLLPFRTNTYRRSVYSPGPKYAQNHHRVVHQAEIEVGISSFTKTRTVDEVVSIMQGAGVPVGRVNSVKEVVEGEQVVARGAVEDVWVGSGGGDGEGGVGERRYGKKGWNVQMPRVFPLLEGCDARTRWAGPELGEHTVEVLNELLGVEEKELGELREAGVVG